MSRRCASGATGLGGCLRDVLVRLGAVDVPGAFPHAVFANESESLGRVEFWPVLHPNVYPLISAR